MKRKTTNLRNKTSLLSIMLFVIATLTFSSSSLAYEWLTEDAEKKRAKMSVGPLKGDKNCNECHSVEVDAWKETRHFKTFKEAHKTDKAKEILAAMGTKNMRKSAECRQCHYTSELKEKKGDETLRAKFGVTCESCHGPAKEWMDIHMKKGGDINGDDINWGEGKLESAEERATRLDKAAAKGMIHSDMIYGIAKNCFGCHTVPNENVVNKGGHLPGSDDFELVARLQGEVIHNFSSAHGTDIQGKSMPTPTNKKRRLYVTGKMVDLETTLNNLANTEDKAGKYHLAMVDRANRVKSEIVNLATDANISLISEAMGKLPATFAANTDTSSMPAMLSETTTAFLKAHDGSKLAALDPLFSE